MKLTNLQIYNYASNLLEEFSNSAELKLPVKVNFYLQKNLLTLKNLATEIEESRLNIIQEYGQINEDGTSYFIPSENIEKAQQELNDLFALDQEVQIYMIKLDGFNDDILLSMSQMESLMFMIE
jgi:hypothetical protein